jgi:hypothetical protein
MKNPRCGFAASATISAFWPTRHSGGELEPARAYEVLFMSLEVPRAAGT